MDRVYTWTRILVLDQNIKLWISRFGYFTWKTKSHRLEWAYEKQPCRQYCNDEKRKCIISRTDLESKMQGDITVGQPIGNTVGPVQQKRARKQPSYLGKGGNNRFGARPRSWEQEQLGFGTQTINTYKTKLYKFQSQLKTLRVFKVLIMIYPLL